MTGKAQTIPRRRYSGHYSLRLPKGSEGSIPLGDRSSGRSSQSFIVLSATANLSRNESSAFKVFSSEANFGSSMKICKTLLFMMQVCSASALQRAIRTGACFTSGKMVSPVMAMRYVRQSFSFLRPLLLDTIRTSVLKNNLYLCHCPQGQT